MSDNSPIEWTEATWNPVAGCSIMSPGCTNCYAMRLAWRLENMGSDKYIGLTRKSGGRPKWNGKINLDWKSLDIPKKWKRGRLIFVNSMSDLFHDDVPLEFIQAVFEVMNSTPQHAFQLLTKRPDRARELHKQLNWSSNIWMGTSVENKDYKWRITELGHIPAHIRFLSLEPLLGPLGAINLKHIDWVIAGGESGPNARPMELQWVRSIRDQCQRKNVAFHFKQWGGTNKKKTGRILDDRTWDEMPARAALPA